MRTLFYLAMVLSFFMAGGWLLVNKDSSSPYEVPYLSETALSLPFGSLIKDETVIPPSEEWKDILVGEEWDFNFILDEGKYKVILKGKVTYFDDGTFTRRVSYSEYNKFDKRTNAMAGGTIRGKWNVRMDSTWVETIEEEGYNLESASGAEGLMADMLLETYFSDTTYYGVVEHNTKDFELLYFKNSKIKIEAKNLSDGLIDSYSFTRSNK